MRKPWHFEDERYFQTTFVRDWEHRGSGWSYPACVSSSCRIKDQTQWNTILVVSLHSISLLSKNGVYPQIAIFMLGQWWLTLMNQSMEWGILFSDNPLFLVEGSLVSALLQWWRMALPAVPGGPFFQSKELNASLDASPVRNAVARCGNQQDLNPTKKLITVIYGASGHDVWVWNGLKVFIHTLRKTVPSTCIINKLCHHKWKLQFCRVWTYMEI